MADVAALIWLGPGDRVTYEENFLTGPDAHKSSCRVTIGGSVSASITVQSADVVRLAGNSLAVYADRLLAHIQAQRAGSPSR